MLVHLGFVVGVFFLYFLGLWGKLCHFAHRELALFGDRMHNKPHQEHQYNNHYAVISDKAVHPFHQCQYPERKRAYDARGAAAGEEIYSLDKAKFSIQLVSVEKTFILRAQVELEFVCSCAVGLAGGCEFRGRGLQTHPDCLVPAVGALIYIRIIKCPLFVCYPVTIIFALLRHRYKYGGEIFIGRSNPEKAGAGPCQFSGVNTTCVVEFLGIEFQSYGGDLSI